MNIDALEFVIKFSILLTLTTGAFFGFIKGYDRSTRGE